MRELTALGYIEEAGERSAKAQRKFTVLKPLPSKEALIAEATKAFYTHTAEDLVGSAQGDLESLKEELESWRDNLSGTPLENTNKYQEVSDACDELESAVSELENIRTEDWPEAARKLPVVVLRLGGSTDTSRGDRCGSACHELECTMEALDKFITDTGEKIEKLQAEGKSTDDIDLDQVTSDRDSMQSCVDTAQGVSFPGMF
jgi:hypothetical protein